MDQVNLQLFINGKWSPSEASAVAVGVGGKLVDKAAMARGEPGSIISEAQRLVNAVRGATQS